MFNATTFPGASATDITQAKNLYAMLTGRISSLTGDARITPEGDQYVPLGLSRAAGPHARVRLLCRRFVARAHRT